MKKRRSRKGIIVLLVFVALFCYLVFSNGGIDYDTEPVARSSNGDVTRFYYEKLTNVEKHMYNMILDKIYDFPVKIEIPVLTHESLNNVFEALFYDNQSLFFLTKSCTAKEIFGTPYFFPSYSLKKDEYEKRLALIDETTQSVMNLIEDIDDDYKKELIIHDYLVNNCVYDEETTFYDNNIYNALVEKKVLCEGYSMAIKHLLETAGIECYVVTGTSRSSDDSTEDHMWNVVKIDGEYYYLDATWNDPLSEDGSDTLRHFYFNATDDDISVTHSQYEKINPCTSRRANYYVRNGLFFTRYDASTRQTLARKIARIADSGERYIEFKFSTAKGYNAAVEGLFANEDIYGVLSSAAQQCDVEINTHKVVYTEYEDYSIITLEIE